MKTRACILGVLALLLGTSCSRDPEVAKRKYVENGNKYFAKGKYKEASIMYRNALKRDMRYGEAYYRLGLVQLRLEQPVAAMRSLVRAVELQKPLNMDAASKLGELYWLLYLSNPGRGKPLLDDLRGVVKQMLAADPKSFDGLRLSGYVQVAGGNIKEAINLLRQADAVKPGDRNVSLTLVQSLSADGQSEEAEKLAKAAIERDKTFGGMYDALYAMYARQKKLDQAEELLKAKVSANPANTDFYIQLATHYYVLQRRAEMEKVIAAVTGDPKKHPNGRLKAADFFLRFREFDRSIGYFQEAANADPAKKHYFQMRIAEAMDAQGKKAEATRLLDQILKEDPKQETARAMRAALRLESGSREEVQSAVSELQAAVNQSPTNAVLRFNLGRGHWAKGELDVALAEFREAIKRQPDYVAPRLAIAQIHMVKREFPMALKEANEILVGNPNHVLARLIRTGALTGLGQKAEARRDLEALLKKNPNSSDALFQLGLLDISDKKFKEAEANFNRMREVQPSDLRALFGTTESLLAQENYDKAIQLLSSELQKTPERTEIRVALAATAARAGRYDMAIAEYKTLIAKSPQPADLYVRLGDTYRRAGNTEGAIEAYQKAKDLRPNEPAAYLALSLLLEAAGRRAEAAKLYEQILRLQPDNPIALNNLAYSIAETGGDLDQALTYAQRAKQKAPDNNDISDTLGWIYIKKNLSDNAIQLYRDLVVKEPGNPVFRYHLAMAFFQKGDKAQARKELQTALANKPRKDVEGRIRELMARIG